MALGTCRLAALRRPLSGEPSEAWVSESRLARAEAAAEPARLDPPPPPPAPVIPPPPPPIPVRASPSLATGRLAAPSAVRFGTPAAIAIHSDSRVQVPSRPASPSTNGVG